MSPGIEGRWHRKGRDTRWLRRKAYTPLENTSQRSKTYHEKNITNESKHFWGTKKQCIKEASIPMRFWCHHAHPPRGARSASGASVDAAHMGPLRESHRPPSAAQLRTRVSEAFALGLQLYVWPSNSCRY